MVKTRTTAKKPPDAHWYVSPNIPVSVIRRYARQVADRFEPDQVILFGSFAYGTPHADSDVDILVVMPARNEIDQSVRISLAIEPPFPLDLIVRTPKNLRRRLKEGDWFLREVMSQGKVLDEKADGGVGPKGGSGLRRRNRTRSRQGPTA
ncbi:MAG TPA: nucleotidyltransferase domain-containing protein [Pirellulales bacterium]|nr:nucleotidyltransferase domain-containing protein [Pirellulales bacterium]